jgi:hypothetical protein
MNGIKALAVWLIASVAAGPVMAQQIDWPSSRLAHPKRAEIGPYNAVFLQGSDGIWHPAQGYGADEHLPEAGQWTLRVWVKPSALPRGGRWSRRSARIMICVVSHWRMGGRS